MGGFYQNASELYINGITQHVLISSFLPSILFVTLGLVALS